MGGTARWSWLVLAGALAALGASCSGGATASKAKDAGADAAAHDAGDGDATDADALAACPTGLDASWSFSSGYACDDVSIDCGTIPPSCRFPVAVQFSGYCSICDFQNTFDAAACRNGQIEIDDVPSVGWRVPNWCCDCPAPDAGN